LQFDQLTVRVYATNTEMGEAAALNAKDIILQTLEKSSEANVILATGNSQLTTLHALARQKGIPWQKVRFFHMDEYIGIPQNHPARFARFLHQHFFDRLPEDPLAFYPVPLLTNADDVDAVKAASQEYESLLQQYPADLCLLGIGENGHLAFNDPPYARFDDSVWVKIVKLSPQSRQQQVHEGHFPCLEDTPSHALTLTMPALLAARKILAIVPEARKARAVHAALYDPISEKLPATILRENQHATLYLDRESGARL